MADIRAQGKLHHPDDERKPAANQKDSPPNSVDDDSTLFAKNNNQSPPNDTRHTGDSADPPDPSQRQMKCKTKLSCSGAITSDRWIWSLGRAILYLLCLLPYTTHNAQQVLITGNKCQI